jgi:hypothetical protein
MQTCLNAAQLTQAYNYCLEIDMPPQRSKMPRTDECRRANRRAISRIESPACQRSHISAFCSSV